MQDPDPSTLNIKNSVIVEGTGRYIVGKSQASKEIPTNPVIKHSQNKVIMYFKNEVAHGVPQFSVHQTYILQKVL